MKKECTKCKQKKELPEFNKLKKSKDGHQGKCRKCFSEYNSLLYEKESERIKKQVNQYRQDNIEKVKAYDNMRYYRDMPKRKLLMKKYRENNVEYIKECRVKYYNENKEYIKEYSKKYSIENKERIKDYRVKYYKENKEILKLRGKEYYNVPINKIKRTVKRTFWAHTKGSVDLAIKILGCSIDYLIKYLSLSYFIGNEKHINWDDYKNHKLQIHHIKPISTFDLSDEKQLKECFHYTNMVILSKEQHLKEHKRLREAN